MSLLSGLYNHTNWVPLHLLNRQAFLILTKTVNCVIVAVSDAIFIIFLSRILVPLLSFIIIIVILIVLLYIFDDSLIVSSSSR